jgi:hypothetical protein
MIPLGYIITALLFCNNPNKYYRYQEWFQNKKDADFMAQTLGDGKWFDYKGRKCIYSNVKVEKERK